MLEWLFRSERANISKLRSLFAACCGHIKHQMTEPMAKANCEMQEQESELDDESPIALAGEDARFTLFLAAAEALRAVDGGTSEQVMLIRRVFDDPFHP